MSMKKTQTDIDQKTHTIIGTVMQFLQLAPSEASNAASIDDEEIRWRQKMVAIHKGNWRKTQEQLAQYGAGEKPLHLLNQLELEEEAIRWYGEVI